MYVADTKTLIRSTIFILYVVYFLSTLVDMGFYLHDTVVYMRVFMYVQVQVINLLTIHTRRYIHIFV